MGFTLAVFGACIGLRPIGDNSFFTHLETGRIILQSGVPTTDPYSFTANGEPWVVQSWLASLFFGLADRWGGGVGVRLLTALLLGILIGLIWRLTRRAKTLLVRILITGLVMAVGVNFWAPRPLLFGLVFFALLLVIFEEGLDPRWAVPVMWVWANCHGSFPLGLVAIAALALGIRLDGRDPKPALRLLAWASIGTVVAAVSPIGPTLLLFPVHLLGRMEILQQVVEWQSPNFSVAWARVFLVQIFAAVIALIRWPRYRAAIPALVFIAAALLGLRNVPLASIMLVPGMARGFSGLGGTEGRERGAGVVAAGVAVAMLAVVAMVSLAGQPSYDLSTYPTDALAWMHQQGLDRSELRVATQDTTGNVIELLWGPSHKVFLDDRYDMYPLPVLHDYLLLHAAGPGWQQVLADEHIDCLLWPRSEPLSQALVESPAWEIRYQDGTSIVACRPGVTAQP